MIDNKKLDRINAEIARLREKLTKYRERMKELEVEKTETENLQIIHLVRSVNLTPAELDAVLSGNTIPGIATIPTGHTELQEDNAYEK